MSLHTETAATAQGSRRHKAARELMSDSLTAGLDGVRVLVVEDEALVAMDLEYLLEDRGAVVVDTCVSNADAAACLEAKDVDAVLLDYNLVDGEAEPTLELARGMDIAVVIHSGHAIGNVLRQTYPDLDVLAKPALPGSIVDALRTAVRRSGPANDLASG